VGAAAIKAIKAILGIKSPSSVFAEIGRQMMTGMAIGISGNAHLPAMASVGAASFTTNSTVNSTHIGSVNLPGVRNVDGFMREMGRKTRNARKGGTGYVIR